MVGSSGNLRLRWHHGTDFNLSLSLKAAGMESFFLAETLKYFWLLFEERDVIDFDKVVFNSQAHPIRKDW